MKKNILLTIQEFNGSKYNHFIEIKLDKNEIKRIKKLQPLTNESDLLLENGTLYASFDVGGEGTFYTTDFMFVGFIMANSESLKPIGTLLY